MATSAGTRGFRPTEEQRLAIEGIRSPMAVDAAAGSGKTAVLIHRILEIVGSDWARLSEILAITFTEKAAGELRAKLRPRVPAGERFRLDAAWIGTFHSFCARLLRRYGPSIEIDPSFRLLDEHQSGMTWRKCVRDTVLNLLDEGDRAAAGLVEEVGFASAAGCIEELMQFRWHADKALAEEGGADEWEKAALASLRSLFARARSNYLSRLAELGALDFQELEIRALELLGDDHVARRCRETFRHILVDEYQDTNDVQTEIVLSLFDRSRNRLFIVGDEAQSIYRFRGANVGCFARVRGIIREAGGKVVRLAHNFRSRRSIISLVNASQEILADGLFSDPSTPKPIEAVKADGRTAPVLRLAVPAAEDATIAALREREAAAIAGTIVARCDAGEWSHGDVVLLFRSMGSAETYEAALRRRSIPCSSTGGRGFLARTEIADLTAALRYAQEPGDSAALLALLRSPIGALSDDDLALMAGPEGRGLSPAVEGDARLSLIAELPRMAEHMRPSEILRRVINEAGLELLWSWLDRSGAANANMDRLVTIARDAERRVPTTLAEFNRFIAQMRDRGAKMGDAPPEAGESGSVRLMTVHAAKGLEFPVVFLPDLLRRPPPRNKQWIFSRGDEGASAGVAFKRRDPAKPFGSRVPTERFTRLADDESELDEMESKRILYVAMTRAIDALVIPIHEGVKDRGSWHGWLRDALDGCRGFVDSLPMPHALSNDGAGLPQGNDGTAPLSPRSAAQRLSVSQLDSYSVCPMQYYLKYVLGLPASEVARYDPERIEPNVYGSIVHAVLARATADPAEIEAAAAAEALAGGVAADGPLISALARDAKKAIGLAGGDPAAGVRELPFELAAGATTIAGTIDWLRPAGPGYEVVDFKTGIADPARAKARAAQYEVQMQAYALAAESITGRPVVSTRLVFPSAGTTVELAMDDARRRAAEREIGRIVSGIEARRFDVPKSPPCEGCIFHINGMCWEDRTKQAKGKRSKVKGTAQKRCARRSKK